ncbi:MAG: helix-turn-helix domain-containing protein [Verrucomicrobia bacterium]|nr:helix-turn-helix domain-containing protein [Verrucomicrobiota bacterium]
MTPATSIFVGTFEESVQQRPNRLMIHRHDYFELFLLEGKGEHFNDFQVYIIEKPSIVCVSPGQVHFWKDKQSLRGPMICFTQEFVEKYASNDYSLLQHRFWFPAGNSPVIEVSKDQVRETGLLIEEVQREFNRPAEGSDRIVRLLLQLILLKMNRFYPSENRSQSSRREAQLVRDFLVNLQLNVRESSVSSHAAMLGVSPETLSETVKKETGKTPGTMIRERILLEAKRLLLHTSLSVAEIGYDLRFKDPSYFNRFFRRSTGDTPVEFRKQCQLHATG